MTGIVTGKVSNQKYQQIRPALDHDDANHRAGPSGGELSPEARELWQQYLAETDPLSREILYMAYMQALNES